MFCGENVQKRIKKTEQGGSFRLLAQRAGYGVMNCTPNVGHNLTSEGAVYETFI
ncbi:hypothetical protein ECDEC1D_5063 [Escherichia coli DEC1D]|nr:hypothetical protein ECDEC1D_5063 [Escherichia coli DEC1D]